MAAKPWYPFFPGDWRAKAAGLSPLERGIYRELLDEYYVRGGPLPDDMAALARIAGAQSRGEKEALARIVDRFFARREGRLHQARADLEVGYRANQAAAGRAGAAARWGAAEDEAGPEPIQATKSADTSIYKDSEPHGESHGEQHDESNSGIDGEPHGTIDSEGHDEAITPQITTTTTYHNHNHKPLTPPPEKPGEVELVQELGTRPTTADTWDAYALAYEGRYGIAPVRNAQVNSQLAQLVKRIGKAESPHVARHYVATQRSIYVASKHSVALLLRDCEGLRTEWATQRSITDTEARSVDATAARGSAFAGLLAEAMARKQ